MAADLPHERADVHPDGPRTATVYPATHPLPDPEDDSTDATTSWPVIALVLLLVPPLGWLLLARRDDVAVAPRVALAALSALWFAALCAVALEIVPRP